MAATVKPKRRTFPISRGSPATADKLLEHFLLPRVGEEHPIIGGAPRWPLASTACR